MTGSLKNGEKEFLKSLKLSDFKLEDEVVKFFERQQAECEKIKGQIKAMEDCFDLNKSLGLSEQDNLCYKKLLEEYKKLKSILAVIGG